jgi:hypothetical protein
MSGNPQKTGQGKGVLERQVVGFLRWEHYSLQTEASYVGCYRRFVSWSGLRFLKDLGEILAFFLTYLACGFGIGCGFAELGLGGLKV